MHPFVGILPRIFCIGTKAYCGLKKRRKRGITKNDILCLSPTCLRIKVSKINFLFSLFPFLSFFMEGHSSNNNLYQVLGIQKTATPEEIKKVISRLL